MSNLPAVPNFDPNLPAFLRQGAFAQVNQRAMANLSAGAPNRISFRAGRFRYISSAGVETLVPENGGTTLDVIVVDANENISKMFFSAPYDPAAAEPPMPDCHSDNGVAPSARASNPQSALCATCPQNIWGSKTTPSGSQVKACSDAKKLAVLPVSNVDGPTYVISIPPASLKAWKAAVDQLINRGIPICAVKFQLGFDTDASHPKLTFMPTGWIDEKQSARIAALIGTPEIDTLLGRNDQARQGALPAPQATPLPPSSPAAAPNAVSAPAPVVSPPSAPAPAAMTGASPSEPAAAPRRRGRPPAAQQPAPAPQNAAEVLAAMNAQEVLPPQQPVPVAAVPLTPPPGMPQHTAAAYSGPVLGGEPIIPVAGQPLPQMPPIPDFLDRSKHPDGPVIRQPQAAPAGIDAMLDQIMARPGGTA